MNQLALVCRAIAEAAQRGAPLTQRALASELEVSLGQANRLIKQAIAAGYITPPTNAAPGTPPTGTTLTPAGQSYLDQFKVDNAIILAAGFGSRFVPLTYEAPKGLLKVAGEPMLERQIRQLHAAGVTEIVIVVGYLKEKFDYLIDQYGVTLVFNPEYATKNNLASLYVARHHLAGSYILVADNWMEQNLFHAWEPDPWLGSVYFEGPTAEWAVTTGARGLVKKIQVGGADTWALLGPCYFTAGFSARYRPLLEQAYATPGTDNWYWEDIVKDNLPALPIYLARRPAAKVREFENLAELQAFDPSYRQTTNSAIMRQIAAALGVGEGDVTDIVPLKNGLTNASFRFTVGPNTYVFRRPQEGSNAWLDRLAEQTTYQALQSLGLSDQVVWLDPASGHRITRFCSGAQPLDLADTAAVTAAIGALRTVHRSGLKVPQRLAMAAGGLARVQALCDARAAVQFSDYEAVKQLAARLLALPGVPPDQMVLVHGDFSPSNVLVLPGGGVTLIDWEQAGMGDPVADVAAFAVAGQVGLERAQELLEEYLERPASGSERQRFYRAAALYGLVSALWTEYRQSLGVAVGEYPLVMYRAAKTYGALALESGPEMDLGQPI
ncbi:MAG: phosphotransferase [Bifidobacteriaceae bacterium]|nr:phosphotransferase [Bifidobacteriaceae bacterium]